MLLNEICNLPDVLEIRGNTAIKIRSLNLDSRKKTSDGLFFCIAGNHYDSHLFAQSAVDNGNVALVVERFLDNVDVAQILVKNTRVAMARISAHFYDYPEQGMQLIGITGTKGKTTTSFMLKAICETAGLKVGLIGTTGNMIGDKRYDSSLTTPDPIDMYSTLALMRNEKVDVVVMEVSAHAIDMHRLEGMLFEVGCYTNFSQDHLDYFKDMDTYFAAKKKFFTDGYVKNAVLNVDDISTERIVGSIHIPHVSFGIGANADVYARDIEVQESGASFKIHLNDVENLPINMKMTGNFNVYNALCAAAAAMVLNISTDCIKRGLESVQSVPGRIELLDTKTAYKVILDYSHSPDSLENILTTVRLITKKNLILLFGCGGDRDHIKRPIMGEIAGKLADISIITSDNPRNENPMQIINAIVEGCKKHTDRYEVIENRRDAIKHALQIAKEGDVIILAGKGHETYQERQGVKYPFNEKIIVKELLAEIEEGR